MTVQLGLYLLLCPMTGAAAGRALAIHGRRPPEQQLRSSPNFFPMLIPGSLAALMVANAGLPFTGWHLGGASMCAAIAGGVAAFRSHS
jgi:hypothetical protein